MTILTEMLGVMAYKFQHVEHQQNIEIYYKTFASLAKVMKLSIFETIFNIKKDSEVLVP